MHGVVASGRLAIERRDMAGAVIDGEGIGLGTIAMHRVEMRAGRIDGEERRVFQSTQVLDVGEGAAAAVDAIDVDAVALATALGRGVAADIGVEGTCHTGYLANRYHIQCHEFMALEVVMTVRKSSHARAAATTTFVGTYLD